MLTATFEVGGWPSPTATLHVVQTTKDLRLLDDWLAERTDQRLGLDAETNALDPFQPGFRTRMIQFADLHESWAVPVWAEDPPGAYRFGGNRQRHLSHLIRRHPRWVAHFAENDERFCARGLPDEPVRWGDLEPHFADSQTVLAMFDPRTVTTFNKKDRIHPAIPRRKGLKDNSTRLLSPTLAHAEAALHARFRELARATPGVRGNMSQEDLLSWGFANIPLDDPTYLLYAALDPLYCIRLFELCRHELERQGRWGRAEASLREQWMIDWATYQGMPVDEPYVRWLDTQLAQVIEDHRPHLEHFDIKPSGQGPSVGRAFMALGVPEQDKWDKEVIKGLITQAENFLAQSQDHVSETIMNVRAVRDLAVAVRDVRKAGKYRSNWVAPMLWTLQHADGSMHPSMRAHGTVTSRMSVQKTKTAGPLHSAPKGDKRIRAAVRAPRGWVVVTADFRQAEPTVMAALSGDPAYLADLQRGDINGILAQRLYPGYVMANGKKPGTESYPLRQGCKFAWLAACYGARDAKVDALLGLPGSGVLEQWRQQYPTFWGYADHLNQQQMIRLDSGHVVPLWDRFWVADDGSLILRTNDYGTPKPSRLGLNAETQGTQADLLKLSMHRIAARGWAWALRFLVHDETVLMVPAALAQEAVGVLQEAMTVRYRGVLIECEATIEGETWQPRPSEFRIDEIPELED